MVRRTQCDHKNFEPATLIQDIVSGPPVRCSTDTQGQMPPRQTILGKTCVPRLRSNFPLCTPQTKSTPERSGGAVRASRSLRWGKLVPLLAVGLVAAGVGMEWFGRDKTDVESDEQDKLARAA